MRKNFFVRTCKLFSKNQRGATALEFSMVALPLCFLLFAILEIGLVFVLNFNLLNATASLGRQLRLGQVIAPGASVTTSNGTQLDLADFKTAICNKMGLVPMATCTSQLQVDVRTLSSFQNQTPPNPFSNGVFDARSLCYYSGGSGSVVELRAYYLWPVLTPVLLSSLVNVTSTVTGGGTSGGQWLMVSATDVFKNEPSSSISNTSNTC
jgi:Flp pilus assembly protein TadG